jgi:hypothetical protein
MKYRRLLLSTLFLFVATVTSASAQECKKLFCTPAFVVQPGIAVLNAFDAPVINARGDRAPSSTELLLRVGTVIPTGAPRLSLIAVVWWIPTLTSETVNASGKTIETRINAPSFLVGPSLSLLRRGPLALSFAVVDGYRPYLRPDENGNVDQYRHNLILIPSASFKAGALLGSNSPPLLRSVSAYGIWQQQVTNMPFNSGPDGRPTGDRAYPPALFFGLTIPIAPAP